MSKKNQPPAVPTSFPQYLRMRSACSSEICAGGAAGGGASAAKAASGAVGPCAAPLMFELRFASSAEAERALNGASRMPGSAPRPRSSRHDSPRSSPRASTLGVPQSATRSIASSGTRSEATPCIEKTSDAVRPRDSFDAASDAIVADSGYTPPTPTPRTNRVIERKWKIVSGRAPRRAAPRTPTRARRGPRAPS